MAVGIGAVRRPFSQNIIISGYHIIRKYKYMLCIP